MHRAPLVCTLFEPIPHDRSRIHRHPHSTPSFASWRQDACSPQSISARAAFPEIRLDITVSPARFTRTSRVRFEDTLVRPFSLSTIPGYAPPLITTIDVLAHRQLASAISHTPLHASLHSKSNVERIMDVINRRHRMAQMAGRASVEFYVGLALKGHAEVLARERNENGQAGEGIIEDAFVIRTFRNGVGVFVFQYVRGSGSTVCSYGHLGSDWRVSSRSNVTSSSTRRIIRLWCRQRRAGRRMLRRCQYRCLIRSRSGSSWKRTRIRNAAA